MNSLEDLEEESDVSDESELDSREFRPAASLVLNSVREGRRNVWDIAYHVPGSLRFDTPPKLLKSKSTEEAVLNPQDLNTLQVSLCDFTGYVESGKNTRDPVEGTFYASHSNHLSDAAARNDLFDYDTSNIEDGIVRYEIHIRDNLGSNCFFRSLDPLHIDGRRPFQKHGRIKIPLHFPFERHIRGIDIDSQLEFTLIGIRSSTPGLSDDNERTRNGPSKILSHKSGLSGQSTIGVSFRDVRTDKTSKQLLAGSRLFYDRLMNSATFHRV